MSPVIGKTANTKHSESMELPTSFKRYWTIQMSKKRKKNQAAKIVLQHLTT